MSFVTTDLSPSLQTSSGRRSLGAWFAEHRERISTYMAEREVYKRTLFELESYSRRDLFDLGIDPDGLDSLARQAAGWKA